MKFQNLSLSARRVLLTALGFLLLCGLFALILCLTAPGEEGMNIDTGTRADLSGAENGVTMFLRAAATDEYFAANYFPTLYGAAGDGTKDDTAPLKQALKEAAVHGGTVYLPRGTYRLTEPVIIPSGVTLRGEFTSPDASSSDRTVIYVSDTEALRTDPLFTLEDGADLMGLTVYYEKQTPGAVIEYPVSVYCTGTNRVRRLALINPYHGLCVTGKGSVEVRSVWMSPLDYGILITDNNTSVCLEDVSMTPTYWLNTVPKLFSQEGAYGDLTQYLHEHLHGIILEQVTDVTVHRCTVDDAAVGLLLNVPAERDAVLLASEISVSSTNRPLYLQSLPAAGVSFSDCIFRPEGDAGANTVQLGAGAKAPVVFSGCTFAGSPKTVIRGENPSFVSFYHCDFGTWWNTCFDMTDSTFLAVAPIFRTSADRAVLGQNAFGLLYGSEALEDSSELLFSVPTDSAVLSGSDSVLGLKDSTRPSASSVTAVYATDYGLDSGAADNAAALSAALARVTELGGGIVFLPEGEFRFASAVTVPASVRLIGVGERGRYRTDLVFTAAQGSLGALVSLENGASLEGLQLVQKLEGSQVCGIASSASQVRIRNVAVTAAQGVRFRESESVTLEHLTLTVSSMGISLQKCTSVTLRDLFLSDSSPDHTLTGLKIQDSQVALSGLSADRLLCVADISGASQVTGTLFSLRRVNTGIRVTDSSEVLLTAFGVSGSGEDSTSVFLRVEKGTVSVQGMVCTGDAHMGHVLSAAGGTVALRAALISTQLPITVQSEGDSQISVIGCVWNSTPVYHAKASDGTVTLNGNLLLSDQEFSGMEGNYLLTSASGDGTVDDGVNVMDYTFVPPDAGGSESGGSASDPTPAP